MIFTRIHIENFGALHDFDLEPSAGIFVLKGANEFGKTTLLEFIRRILWGYPDKRRKLNIYPPLSGTGRYGGFIDAVMRDGKKLRLERYGEKSPLTLRHDDGQVEEVPDISGIVPVSELFYRNVYAVTLDELSTVSTLDDQEIRNRIYGAGLTEGTLSLSRLRELFRARADAIYLKRGKKHLFKTLSEQLDEAEKELAAAAEALPLYDAALAAAAEAERRADLLRKKTEETREAIRRIDRQLQAAEISAECAGLEAELRKIPVPVSPSAPEIPDALRGKCDAERARTVSEESIGEAVALDGRKQTLDERNQKTKKAEKRLFAVIGGIAATAVGAAMEFPWYCAAALLAAGMLLGAFRWKKIQKQLNLIQDESARRKNDEAALRYRFALSPETAADEFPEVLRLLAAFQQRREQFLERLSRHSAAAELHRKIGEKLKERRAALETLLAGEPFDGSSAGTFQQRRGELTAAAAKQNAELEEAIRSAGAERQKAEQLEARSESIEILNRRETLRAEMQSAAHEFLRWRGAEILLERAVAKFEREQQPEVIRRAAELFSGFTSGRYTGMRKPLESPELLLTDSLTGLEKNVADLSRGSREQLFIAMRLALIECLERDNEPLPVVLDDILVNFDRTRRAALLAELEACAENRQVIIFQNE